MFILASAPTRQNELNEILIQNINSKYVFTLHTMFETELIISKVSAFKMYF